MPLRSPSGYGAGIARDLNFGQMSEGLRDTIRPPSAGTNRGFLNANRRFGGSRQGQAGGRSFGATNIGLNQPRSSMGGSVYSRLGVGTSASKGFGAGVGSIGSISGQGIKGPAARLQDMRAAAAARSRQTLTNTGAAAGRAAAAAGGKWGILDGMTDDINKAAASTGVPANLIKAMLYREGGGKGHRNVSDIRSPNDLVYAFNGIFQSTAASWGIDFNRMLGDDAYAIWAMGKTLSGIRSYNNLGSWEDTAAFYFAGPNNYKNPGWGDEVGNTVESYLYHPEGGVISNMRDLDKLSGGTNAAPVGGGGGGGSLQTIFGGTAMPETQGFGWTDWARGGGAYMYDDISPSYWGYEGGHNGRDYGAAYGTQMYSNVSGTVITAGGTNFGYGPAGPGVAGQGELKIRLDNGDVVVYGHSASIQVGVGQRVTPGMPIATVGYMGGMDASSSHLHLETYRYDPSFNGNTMHLRLVDPAGYFGGGTYTGPTGNPGSTASIPGYGGSLLERFRQNGYKW